MSVLVWLGLALGVGVAFAASGDGDGGSAKAVDYKGFNIQVAPTELGTWAFAVRMPGRADPIAIGVYTDEDAATEAAKAWIDANFPGGPGTVPLGYGEEHGDDDGTDPESDSVRPEDVDQVDDDGMDPETPVPIPTPTSSSAELPPNYQVLRDATALQDSQLLQAVEGNPSRPRTVFVGADDTWGAGRLATFAELQRLAIERPDVNVRVFSFATTRALVNLPPASPFMSYVAVAVDSTGRPGPVLSGVKRDDPAIGRETLTNLFELAAGTVMAPTELPPGAVLHRLRRPGDPPSRVHIVLVQPEPDGRWAWRVWRGRRQGEPLGQGQAPDHDKALERAKHFVQWYVPSTTPTGLSPS